MTRTEVQHGESLNEGAGGEFDGWGSEGEGSGELWAQRPGFSRFVMHELPAWKPMHSTGCALFSLLSVAGCLIPLGAVLLAGGLRAQEVVVHYGNECILGDHNCTLPFSVHESLSGPVHVYYEVSNYLQNHRRYSMSRDTDQLSADVTDARDVTHASCGPIMTACFLDVTTGSGFDCDTAVDPCGLVAWSFFNDTFLLFDAGGKKIPINETGISWSSDTSVVIGHHKASPNFNTWPPGAGGGTIAYTDDRKGEPCSPEDDTGIDSVTGKGNPGCGQWLDGDEHFVVHMRGSTLPTIRKLWGRLDDGLRAGEYTLIVANHYNSRPYGGEKRFVLASLSWVGGPLWFLGSAYIILAMLYLASASAVLLPKQSRFPHLPYARSSRF